MHAVDIIATREIPVIQRIIQDETWLEGERRGCHVLASDPVVRQRVCEVILRIGHELRESLSRDITGPVLGVPAHRVGEATRTG